jgi:hypothetical protein
LAPARSICATGSQPIPDDLKRRMERYYMPENAPKAAAT